MACRKPVITTSIGGNTSVVKNGINGLLIPPGNIEKLEQSIRMLLKNEKLASQLAQKGYESIIRTFDLNKMLDAYEKLFLKEIVVKRNLRI
jgi:glycosyltransferase involved in cell wall biosynthesis